MKRRIIFAVIAVALAFGVINTPAHAGRTSRAGVTSIGDP